MAKPQEQDGYTLLELLVAFSLLLLIASLVFDGLKFGNRVWASTRESASAQQEIVLTSTLLKDWIANAYPVARQTGDHVDFTGGSRKMEFVAPLNPGSLDETFYRIELELDTNDKALIARWREMDGHKDGERVLLRDVKDLDFSYLGELAPNSEVKWQSRWENQRTLPGLVKIIVTFDDDSKLEWPALVAETKIDWGADCLFDATSNFCRRRSR